MKNKSVYFLSNILFVKVEDVFLGFPQKKTDFATTPFYKKSFSLSVIRYGPKHKITTKQMKTFNKNR